MCDPYEKLTYSIDQMFRLFGRRWSSQVLLEINRGNLRYSQLERALPSMSSRTLSARISDFQRFGIISASHRDKIGVTYQLTEKGKELMNIYNSVATFSIRWDSVA